MCGPTPFGPVRSALDQIHPGLGEGLYHPPAPQSAPAPHPVFTPAAAPALGTSVASAPPATGGAHGTFRPAAAPVVASRGVSSPFHAAASSRVVA